MIDDGGRTIRHLLDARAAADPEAVAVAVVGGASLTYGQVQQRSDAVARGLVERGVAPGDPVILLFAEGSWDDFAVGYHAVVRAGAVAVPVALTLDRRSGLRVAADCRAVGVVFGPGVRPPAGPWGTWPLAELGKGGGAPASSAVPAPTDPAEILYLLRPLAAPQAINRSHAEVVRGVTAQAALGEVPRSVLHVSRPGSHAAQTALLSHLGPRPALALAGGPGSSDPDRFCAIASSHAVEAVVIPGSMAARLLDSGALARHDLSRLRWLMLSSGIPSPALMCRLSAATAAAVVTLERLPDGSTTLLVHDRRRPGALGRPSDGHGPVHPAGGGPQRGATAGLSPAGSPFEAIRLADGDFVYLLAAGDRVVRWRDAYVVAAEVEQVLVGHPGVAEACLLGLPDDDRPVRLVAAVTPGPGGCRPGPHDLIRLVSDRLGPARAPTDVVMLEELPRNARGVRLLRRLRERLGAPVADSSEAAPPSPVEEAVASAWERVLGRRPSRPADDFFEMGGSEVDATRMLALVEDAAGVRVPLRPFLARPTVAGVASSVEDLAGRKAQEDPGVAPAAFSQEGMLWHEHFAPGCQNLPALVRRYSGPLDAGALERALEEIVRRHEPLRTNFGIREGRLVQSVLAPAPLRLPVRDLAALAPAEQEAELSRTVAEEGSRPFDLTTEPLFRPSLLRLGDDHHVLVIRAHHSVYDDWSVGVFRRELSALYRAFAAGAPSPLPEPALRFGDFARGQRRAMAGRKGLEQLSYWRHALAGAPFVTQLPVGDPAVVDGAPQGAPPPVTLVVPPEIHGGLRELARAERTTLFMTVLAAFGVLVHRHTGQDDMLLASVVANRNRTELEGLIGCFTKKVPLRLRVADGATFSEVLAGTRASLLGALSHQDVAFETVLQETLGAPAAARGLVPHVVVMFQGVAPRADNLALPGLTTAGLETSATARRAHFMASDDEAEPDGAASTPAWGCGLYQGTFLIVSMAESPEELVLTARGAFHPPAVERLLADFRALLADLVARPGDPVSRPAAIPEEAGAGPGERRADAPGTGGHRSIAAAFAAQVARTPSALAVDGGDEKLTFAELDVSAERLAASLRRAGAGPGAGVAICGGPSVDLVVATLAVWRTGAAVVPLEPSVDDDALAAMVEAGSVRAAVAASGPVPQRLARHATVLTVRGDAPENGPAPPVPAAGHDDRAMVLFGGGGQAAPAGVVIGHSSVLALQSALAGEVCGPGDPASRLRVCLSATATEDPFLGQLSSLLGGHPLRSAPSLEGDPGPVLALLAAGEVDVVHCTSAQFERLVAGGLARAVGARPAGSPPPSLVVTGREPHPPAVLAAAESIPGARVHLVYGPPECTFGVTACLAAAGRRPAGHPLPHVSVSVLDRRGRRVPTQVEGELHVAGQAVALGYAGDGARPGGAFELAAEGQRRYRTGQRARRLPDGSVELLGPLHRAVSVGGFVVDLSRMEACLSRSADVAGVAVTAEPGDGGHPRLVAHVVPAEGREVSLAALRAFLWRELPGYAWPTDLVLVGSVGGAAGGGAAGGGAASGPAGRPQPRDARRHDVAATTATERELTSAWAQALGVSGVAAEENYWQQFSFLEALRLAEEWGTAPGGPLVTRSRTVEMLAAAVEAGRIGADGGRQPHEPPAGGGAWGGLEHP